MSTPAERKALLFFGVVAMLGAGVRVWRATRPAPLSSPAASAEAYGAEPDPKSGSGSGPPRSARSSGLHRTTVRVGASASRTGQINRDSNSMVDIDRATVSEIDALGVLPKGLARLIVADRDSLGPFGSIDELRRIPFISASTLRKLAPRVTFSRVPRPRNTVMYPRPLPAASTRRGVRGQQ
jgi:DNA uptake protein ComE-like DNA-binding protein